MKAVWTAFPFRLDTGTIMIKRTSVNLVDLARETVMAAEQRLETSRRVEEISSTKEHSWRRKYVLYLVAS